MRLISILFLIVGITSLAYAAYPDVVTLINSTSTNVTSRPVILDKGANLSKQIQVVMGGASANSATVTLQGSLDGDNWSDVASFSMASSPVASKVQDTTTSEPWTAWRAVVASISSAASATVASGTAATITVNMTQ